MLQSITKRYMDESDMKQFKFTFYCDCCGKEIPTDVIAYENRFRKKLFLSGDEREARNIMYFHAHEAAYERANNEARLGLNRCEICKELVCGECACHPAELEGGVCCRRCTGKLMLDKKHEQI